LLRSEYPAHAMKRIALLLLVSLASTLHADDRKMTTDGTYWTGLNEAQKVYLMVGFVSGYDAGIGDGISGLSAKHPNDELPASVWRDYPTKITYGTLVEGMDKCYSDFRNSKLNIQICFDWTVRGVKGESDSDRDGFLRAARTVVDAQ
jgi:hypothetical protein